MFRRCLFATLILLLAPSLAAAQAFELLPRSRVALTPFVGYRVPFTRTGYCEGFIQTGPVTLDVDERVEEERGGGAAVGGELELRVWGPLSLLGSVAYSRPPGREEELAEDEPLLCPGQQPQMWLARAGLLIRLPDPAPDRRRYRPAGFLVVAPGVIRESFREGADATFTGPRDIDHPALNLGALVVWPLGSPHVALSVGLEDYITFWNTPALEDRFEAIAAQQPGGAAEVNFAFDQSHLLFFRAGVSFRF